MGRRGEPTIGEQEAARRALSAWRREFGGRGRPIPERLWAMAAAAARVEGVSTTARVLGLDAKRLAARAARGETAELSLGHPMQFVELSPLRLPARAGSEPIIVELIGRDGERMRVEFPSRAVASAELVKLAGAFWSRGR